MALRVTLAGGAIFWLPDLILYLLRDPQTWAINSKVLTVLLPVITVLGFSMLKRFWLTKLSWTSLALLMLLGIWLWGPLFMMINWSAYGGGFASSEGWRVSIVFVFFPLLTYMMSTYDGTLFALLLTTLALTFLALAGQLSWLKYRNPVAESRTIS